MTFITADWARESSTSTTTGDFALGGALSPGRVFSAVCADGDTFEYSIGHDTLNEFETGLGTYESTGNLLLRTTVYTSSNSNALVNFSAGTKTVELVNTAKRISASGTAGNTITSGSAGITLSDGDIFSLSASTNAITGITFTNGWPGRRAWIKFLTARTLTHSSPGFILPTAANITTASGDYMLLIQRSDTQYDVPVYYRASGQALVQPASSTSIINNAGSPERAALTGDVTASQNSNATTIANGAVTLAKQASIAAGRVIGLQGDASGPATPVALTGAEIGEILRVGTVQSESGSLPLAITLNADTTFLSITTSGDGDIRTITGSSLGRVVLVMMFGTGTKTFKHNFSAGTSTALICPGLADFKATVRSSFLLIGLGTDGWQVVSAPLTTIADDTFLANVSGSTGLATSKTFSSLAGTGLTYDATNHEIDVDYAVESDQETATSNVLAVTPGVQHHHPSAAKFWCKVNGDGSGTSASYNVSSITDVGVGDMEVNIAVPFTSGNWAVTLCVAGATTSLTAANCDANRIRGANQDTDSVRFQNYDLSAGAQDPFCWYITGFGQL